jgi:glutathione S-transferase
MKLFYVPGACSLSPHIVALELGLPVEFKRVDRTTKQVEGSGGDYNKINTKSYVPALQLDNGEVLTEGAVIVQYLADQKPDAGMIPTAGSMERYRLQEWLNFIATEIHKGFSPLFNPNAPKEIRDAGMERLSGRLTWLENALGKKPYLMGDKMTVADAYLFTCLRWSARTNVDLGKWPGIRDFMGRMNARPKVIEALKGEE